jgi:hypothetical protein
MFSMEVKEQASCTLWALAGQTIVQQKYIAERIGIPQLIEILLRDSEKLQYVGPCIMLVQVEGIMVKHYVPSTYNKR